MKSMLRTARTIASKDLRIELRSRVVTNQVIPFAALVMILFAFALDSDAVLERVAPGLVWLATIFSVLFIVARSFALETADGALEALRAAGVDPMGIFLGKTLALATQLIALEAVLVGASVVLYRADVSASGGVLLVTTAVLATVFASPVHADAKTDERLNESRKVFEAFSNLSEQSIPRGCWNAPTASWSCRR